MTVTATLKVVLRELPPTHEHDGVVSMTLENEPKGLPKGAILDKAPLQLHCAAKQWRTACTKAEKLREQGVPPLLLVEAHVGVNAKALIGIVKGIQVLEGKQPAEKAAAG
jgi:hypothetical protein